MKFISRASSVAVNMTDIFTITRCFEFGLFIRDKGGMGKFMMK